MTTEALKSASVTNRDATPALANTAGEGGAGQLKSVNDYFTPTSGKTVGSTYRVIRLKSTAHVKHIFWEAGAMTQGPFDVGAYYSDAADGTQPALAGTVIDADFFASAVSAASAVGITDITNESGTYTADKRNKQLWDALGLTSDPGGFIPV